MSCFLVDIYVIFQIAGEVQDGAQEEGHQPGVVRGRGELQGQGGSSSSWLALTRPQNLLKAALTNSKRLKADTTRDTTRDTTMSDVTNRTHNVTGLDSR